MFKNYLMSFIRIIKKQKSTFLLNLVSLVIVLSVSIFMLIYIINEKSYDNYHNHKEKIVRVLVDWGKNESVMKFAGVMPALADYLNNSDKSIDASGRIVPSGQVTIENSNRSITNSNFYYADSEIFKIFSFKFIRKDNKSFKEPNAVYLSKSLYYKLKGLGRTAENLIINSQNFKIAGIYEDVQINSHFRPDAILSIKSLQEYSNWNTSWLGFGGALTYIKFKTENSIDGFQKKVTTIIKKNAPEWYFEQSTFSVQKLEDIHWNSEYLGDMGAKGNKTYVQLFTFATIILIIIALINYFNMVVSINNNRMKEIGIRKILGANKKSIMQQLVFESLANIIIAFAFSICVYLFLEKIIMQYLETDIQLLNINISSILLSIISLFFIVSFIGFFPANFVTNNSPLNGIKNTLAISGLKLKKITLSIQIVIAVFLIFGAFIINRQFSFIMNQNLGFNGNNTILYKPIEKRKSFSKEYKLIKNELEKVSNVHSVTGLYTFAGISGQYNMTISVKGDHNKKGLTIQALPVDINFIKAFDLQIQSGRDFSEEYGDDNGDKIILNEKALEYLGITNPMTTIVQIPDNFGNMIEAKVIGVVKNFNFRTLHKELDPCILIVNTFSFSNIAVRLKNININEITSIKNKIEILYGSKIEATPYRDFYRAAYKMEEKAAVLVSIFTIVSVLISGIGLFSFMNFYIQKKLKEIAVRKVLGATTRNIFKHIIFDLRETVLGAILLVIPVAYYFYGQWLDNFAYHISIRIIDLFIVILLSVCILLSFVVIKIINAAGSNPIKVIKSE